MSPTLKVVNNSFPSRILTDTLKTFSNEPLPFVVNQENYSVEIVSEIGNYQLTGNNADEFPKIPKLSSSSSVNFSSEIFANAIGKTLFASGK